MRLTNQQVRDQFEDLLNQMDGWGDNKVNRDDSIAMREAFSIYVDGLNKDGIITDHQANTIANPY